MSRSMSRAMLGLVAAIGAAVGVSGAAPQAPAPLKAVSFDAMLAGIKADDARYTLVDCWASWCGPCKENYPHLKEMDQKYAAKGLKVVAMSFDGGTGETDLDEKEIAAARKFIAEQGATFANYRLDEERDQMFEKFDISTIPAVFVYDASGKEVKRYTWDDPNNQFTYKQVEEEVAALLGAAR
jgi:thiol-disulfide isomerase/thioredoxin